MIIPFISRHYNVHYTKIFANFDMVVAVSLIKDFGSYASLSFFFKSQNVFQLITNKKMLMLMCRKTSVTEYNSYN